MEHLCHCKSSLTRGAGSSVTFDVVDIFDYPQVNADIVAFLLQVNKFPAGHDELEPDASLLKAIAITQRPPAP